MNQTMLVLLLTFCAIPCFAAEEVVETLHFKLHAFSIAPLEDPSDTTSYKAVTMSLPTTDGFAPNVNILIQPYAATIEDYSELSKNQIISAKLKLISETGTESSRIFEYSGDLAGQKKLHFYAKAIMRKGKVYLTTGTAKESQWEAVGEKLKKCVESFKLD